MTVDWSRPDSEFAHVERIIHERRSSMLIDRDREVPRPLLERLCRLVFAAPNHKRTAPWQVAVFTGAARVRLGEYLSHDLVEADPAVDLAKLEKTRTKYLRAPAMVVVGCRPDPDGSEVRHREDLAAVAGGIQNLLLAASSAGLQCLWSSPPTICPGRTCALAGFEDGTELVGLVYVGWPASPAPPATRAEPRVSWRHAEGSG